MKRTRDVDALVAEFRQEATYIAYREARGWNACWTDDLVSAALEGLVRAAQRYDGRIRFMAYANRVIRGAVVDEKRRLLRSRKDVKGRRAVDVGLNGSLEALAEIGFDPAAADDPAGEVDAAAGVDVIAQVCAIFGSRDGQILYRYLIGGETQARLAAEFGLTHCRISQIIAAARPVIAARYTKAVAA